MRVVGAILIWFVSLAWVFLWAYTARPPNFADEVTRKTVWVALLFYGIAAGRMPRLSSQDWRCKTSLGRLVQWYWTLAWAAFVIHVGVAFHFYHHWSHAAAVEHVRERSGVGEGIFASYLFTLCWTADVAWWWLRPVSYAIRPRWIDRTLYSFMFMMIFFATVVYEDGLIRWIGIYVCCVFAVGWLRRR